MTTIEKPISVTHIPNTTGVRLVEPFSGDNGGYTGLSDVPILAWRICVWEGGLETIDPIGPHGCDTIEPYLLLDGGKYIWPGSQEFLSAADALQALNSHEERVAELRAKVEAKKTKPNG